MGDHPPITPCRANTGELSGDMARLYELCTRHFIASVSHDAVWTSTRVELKIDVLEEQGKGQGSFTLAGKVLKEAGWLAVVKHKQYGDKEEGNDLEDEEEKALPEFNVGELIPLFSAASASSSAANGVSIAPSAATYASLDVKEKMTTPPSYLTESELIGKMEANGIGTGKCRCCIDSPRCICWLNELLTLFVSCRPLYRYARATLSVDASIATHIENIQKRNYVELASGRKLVPSKLGLVLANGYHLIDSSLVLPQVRADIEDQCNKIAKGLADKDAVLKKAIGIFADKFANFVENVSKMDVLFRCSFARLQDVGLPFTRCGKTRRYLSYIVGPPPRLYNKWTEEVFPLPAGGIIKQATGQKCPLCTFELCLYQVRSCACATEERGSFLCVIYRMTVPMHVLIVACYCLFTCTTVPHQTSRFCCRSVDSQLGHSPSVQIASIRANRSFLAKTRAPWAKAWTKKMSTKSVRFADLLAAGRWSSNALIPTRTLSSGRGPSRRILIAVVFWFWTRRRTSTASCRLEILQLFTSRRKLRR